MWLQLEDPHYPAGLYIVVINWRTEVRTRHLVLFIIAWISYLLLLPCTSVYAEESAGTEKLQNIRKLIVILGGLDLQQLDLRDEPGAQGTQAPQPQAGHGEDAAKGAREKALQGLIDRLVPVYDKHLTDADVSEMLRFYESPTGKRVARAMPQLREESTRIVQEWRKEIAGKQPAKRGSLIRPVTAGNTAAVKELLSEGADVNERSSHGMTPLIMAAHKGNLELTKLLVEKGADVNATTRKGVTPLMAAVEAGSPEVAELLLSKGADANAREELGVNAFQLALMRGQQKLITLLKDRTRDKKAVRLRVVVNSSAKGKDCVPVMSMASESSKKMTCLKPGQEVRARPRSSGKWRVDPDPAPLNGMGAFRIPQGDPCERGAYAWGRKGNRIRDADQIERGQYTRRRSACSGQSPLTRH